MRASQTTGHPLTACSKESVSQQKPSVSLKRAPTPKMLSGEVGGGDYIDRTGKYININFTMKITH